MELDVPKIFNPNQKLSLKSMVNIYTENHILENRPSQNNEWSNKMV